MTPVILKNKTLEEWFLSLKKFKELPEQFDYPAYYKNASNELNKWVHPYVNEGAMITDGGYLTDHGPDHIKKIIERITSFIEGNDYCDINHFEALLLLLAAHIHDVGNIFGRNNHHLTANKVLEKIGGGTANQFKMLWQIVLDIASAHKGEELQNLAESDHYISIPYRPQLLAAIIKFADELAEDCSRARRFPLEIGIIREKVPQAELYHAYASSLISVKPDIKRRTVEYSFKLEENVLAQTFLKEQEDKSQIQIHLIDEIYLRTLKAHDERVYCGKYLRPYINFDRISVKIEIKREDGQKITKGYILDDLRIAGVSIAEFIKIKPDMENYTGSKIIHNLDTF